jgi:hypothetical protein
MKSTSRTPIPTISFRRKVAAFARTAPLLSALILTVSSAHAQVLYQENFTNALGQNRPLTDVGWSAYYTPTGTAIGGSTAYLAHQTGNPNSSSGFFVINASSAELHTDYAAVTTYNDFAGGTPMNLNNTVITWVQGNNNVNTSVRLLIQTGGDGTVGSGTWFASNTAFTTDPAISSAANFASAKTDDLTKTITFSLSASEWNAFTLNPNTALSLGSPLGTDLSTSVITGIGFYISTPTTTNSVSRIDTLTVTVVPEPSTALLAGVGLALTVIGFRRSFRIRQP